MLSSRPRPINSTTMKIKRVKLAKVRRKWLKRTRKKRKKPLKQHRKMKSPPPGKTNQTRTSGAKTQQRVNGPPKVIRTMLKMEKVSGRKTPRQETGLRQLPARTNFGRKTQRQAIGQIRIKKRNLSLALGLRIPRLEIGHRKVASGLKILRQVNGQQKLNDCLPRPRQLVLLSPDALGRRTQRQATGSKKKSV